jgi:FkbM family methyltransferase
MGNLAVGASFSHQVPPELVRIAKDVCPRNPIICEIGSRDALDGIYLSTVLDAAECHIFEPDPSSIGNCRANIAEYGQGRNIILNAVALSDRTGSAHFYAVDPSQSDNKDRGFSSMFPISPVYASARRGRIIQRRITVPTTTLDSYFEGNQRWPDLLWIDVEGAEKLVLAGGLRTLSHVSLIYIEVSFRPMQIGKPLWWEIDKLLRGQQFRLLKFIEASRWKAFMVVHRLLPNPPWHWNAIYLRSRKAGWRPVWP